MASIEAQLELEKEMAQRGADNYLMNKKKAEEAGRGSETEYARRLMQEYINPIADEIERIRTKRGPGPNARANTHLRNIDPYKAAFIALRIVFNMFTDEAKPVDIANHIGKSIEDELRFSRFEQKFGAYYTEIMKDFKRKGTKDYRYMHRVLTHSANTNEDGWQSWSLVERVEMGMKLLNVILECTDLIVKDTYYKRGKTFVSISPSAEAVAWIDNFDAAAQVMHPERAPCIIPPDDWTDIDQGGYYSPELRSKVPLVLTSHRNHRKLLRKLSRAGRLQQVMDAVNGAQAVGWRINDRVLQVAKQIWAGNLGVGMPHSEKLQPPESPFVDIKKEEMTEQQLAKFVEWKREASEIYTLERERISHSFQVASIFRIANKYREYPSFWYVWTLDFRGRMYTTTSGMSPQGPDLAKGMLMFSEGKRLGPRGVYWLKVHGANRFGNDKVHYDDRVKWVDENHEHFMRAASDPLGNLDVWSNCDKPFQFLAFLFEYKDMHDGALVGQQPEDYISHLPVGLDGSCNGLQHFSAMLRDEVGGKATNLTPAPVPNDIYREVGDVCFEKVKLAGMTSWITFANMYGSGKLPRSVAKRPVMTMPYGSTRQSCTTYIYQAIAEKNKKHFGEGLAFKSASELTPLLWSSIGEVVIAARQGMDWLQKCASTMSKQGLPITWRTMDGFIVYLHEREIETIKINTQLSGRYQVRVGNYSEVLDKNAQRNGVAPNFVHSQDSAHLRATILAARAEGIKSLALIHDDYGTHAADTDRLHRIIRECFVRQYTEFDPLACFKQWQEMTGKLPMPEMPSRGTLDINEVLRSEFFFG